MDDGMDDDLNGIRGCFISHPQNSSKPNQGLLHFSSPKVFIYRCKSKLCGAVNRFQDGGIILCWHHFSPFAQHPSFGARGFYNITLPQQRWQEQEVWNYTVKLTHLHCMFFPTSNFRSIRDLVPPLQMECLACSGRQMKPLEYVAMKVNSVFHTWHHRTTNAAVILGVLNFLPYLFGWTGPHRITRSLWVQQEYPPSELDPIGSCSGSSCHAIIGLLTLALGFFVELPPLSGDRDDISNFCFRVSCFCLWLRDVQEGWGGGGGRGDG
jgi:hypothetical protein